MWIYKITNKVSGKMYIGQTIIDVHQRWNQHCTPSSAKKNAITAAIKTYGRDSFVFEVIDTATSIEELNQKEIEYIQKFNTIAPNGYNLEQGGISHIRHAETAEKISKAHKGHTRNTPEVRAKISLGLMKYYGSAKVDNEKVKKLRKVVRKTQSLEDILCEVIEQPLHLFATKHGLTLRQIRKSLLRGYSRLNHDKSDNKKHAEYTVWKGMIQRCYGENGSLYSQYGGRGIRVCWRWLNSFQNFISDMGPRPDGCILGRKDVDAWYSPENCYWVKHSEHIHARRPISKQSSNRPGTFKRGNRWRAFITHNYKRINIGTFATEEEAYKAYCHKFNELHGKYPGVDKELI
jgi:group I intron endonuclease